MGPVNTDRQVRFNSTRSLSGGVGESAPPLPYPSKKYKYVLFTSLFWSEVMPHRKTITLLLLANPTKATQQFTYFVRSPLVC